MTQRSPLFALLTCALCAGPLAALAQSRTAPIPAPLSPEITPPPPPEIAPSEPGLLEDGLKRLFDGLLGEMEPALRDLGQTLQGYEPLMRDLAGLVGDLENYQSPERLPNGDILLRRKPGAPPPPPLPNPEQRPPAKTPPAEDEGAIDL